MILLNVRGWIEPGKLSGYWRGGIVGACISLACMASAYAGAYTFEGPVPRPVLESYLARSMTVSDLLLGHMTPYRSEVLAMVERTGAKFLGRAALVYGFEGDFPGLAADLPSRVAEVHAIDPEIIVQGAIFEFVSRDIEQVSIPSWVFEAFGLPVAIRTFDYDAMGFACQPAQPWEGAPVEAQVPSLARTETQLWYYYVAVCYIDAGIEAIHLGQLEWISECTDGYAETAALIGRIRDYAAQNARRRWVLLDAHTHGIVRAGRLLLDFHAYPARVKEGVWPTEGLLEAGFLDSIYGKSKGGIHPAGWTCVHAPYLVELDHGYGGPVPGECAKPECVWGYDEITWFALLEPSGRDAWLRYASAWLRETDVNGFLEMPGLRQLEAPAANGSMWYFANAMDTMPYGFGQEDAIATVWQEGTGARLPLSGWTAAALAGAVLAWWGYSSVCRAKRCFASSAISRARFS